MNPILVDREASEILTYPHRPETQKSLDDFLAGKIGSMLLTQSSHEPALVAGFQSGRRLYRCRAYQVSSPVSGGPQTSVAVVLERGSKVADSFMEVSKRFHLTTREQEFVQYLFEGLTTKEIAGRLKISPPR
jgi:DNA-binding NarL/FixJ family response regulator